MHQQNFKKNFAIGVLVYFYCKLLISNVYFSSKTCMQHLLNITKSLEKIERLLQGSRLSQEVTAKEPEGCVKTNLYKYFGEFFTSSMLNK